MDNPRFNLGDEVVCIIPGGRAKKNEIYDVKNIIYCQCGQQMIDLGHTLTSDRHYNPICHCQAEGKGTGFIWYNPRSFALIQNMTAQIEEALEEPILI